MLNNKVDKKNVAMTVLSLFSGCGGSDLGIEGGFSYLGKNYKKLPFKTHQAIDIDSRATESFQNNFNSQVIEKSITDVATSELAKSDVVIGGFPCQSFSTVNPTKNPFDERAKLYKEMARILGAIKPVAFIAENVRGLMVLKNGLIFKGALNEFSKKGYRLSYKLLNAADYGVPQKRLRVFIVGIRKDLGFSYVFPKPTNSEKKINGLNRWVGINRIIDRTANKNERYFFSKKAVLGMKRAKNNMKRGLAQNLNKPCLTITSHLAKVSLNSRDPVLLIDPKNELYRRFSPLEAARIQSFPDHFVFSGSDADTYRQIGNAIPPVLMWYVANSLVIQLKRGS